ncbi:hypothetical protein BDZ89DRAFT_1114873 [Hymenopellis radicata]|nr:hypothetical protein BDZ89DRAFT_1114873 [Hymenopellis radicata]
MMILHGFEPMGSVPPSPAFFAPFPERRAAYVDWDSPSVIEDIYGYGKPKLLKEKLQPITRPLLSPFVVSSSNPYPPETDAPVVRAVKAVVRLGRPKKFGIKLTGRRRHAGAPTPSPLVRKPTSIVPEGCYTLVEKNGYFVEKKERRFSGKKIKDSVAQVCRRASQASSQINPAAEDSETHAPAARPHVPIITHSPPTPKKLAPRRAASKRKSSRRAREQQLKEYIPPAYLLAQRCIDIVHSRSARHAAEDALRYGAPQKF